MKILTVLLLCLSGAARPSFLADIPQPRSNNTEEHERESIDRTDGDSASSSLGGVLNPEVQDMLHGPVVNDTYLHKVDSDDVTDTKDTNFPHNNSTDVVDSPHVEDPGSTHLEEELDKTGNITAGLSKSSANTEDSANNTSYKSQTVNSPTNGTVVAGQELQSTVSPSHSQSNIVGPIVAEVNTTGSGNITSSPSTNLSFSDAEVVDAKTSAVEHREKEDSRTANSGVDLEATFNKTISVSGLDAPDLNNDTEIIPPVLPINQTETIAPVLPINQTETIAPVLPINQTETIAPVLPINQTETIAPVLPINQTETIAPVLPINQTDTIAPVLPINQTETIAPVLPINQTETIAPVLPINQTETIAPVLPINQTDTIAPVLPINQTETIAPVLPINQTETIAPVLPINQTETIAPVLPINQTDTIAPVLPINQTETIAPVLPINQTETIAPVLPINQTETIAPVLPINQTETIAPVLPINQTETIAPVLPINQTETIAPVLPINQTDTIAPVLPINQTETIAPVLPINQTENIFPVLPINQTENLMMGQELALSSEQHAEHDHLSAGNHPTFLQPSESAGIMAGVFVGLALLGYVGLLVWRRILEKRYGNREMLVNEDDFYDTSDLKHFEL